MITNKHGLPDNLIAAIKHHNKPAGDISITQLADAPQIRALRKVNDVEEDISERVWLLISNAVYKILIKDYSPDGLARTALLDAVDALEALRGKDPDEGTITKVQEWIRKKVEIYLQKPDSSLVYGDTISATINGYTIFDTFHLYNKATKHLIQFKTPSVWDYIYTESRKKWDAQINSIAYMMGKKGMPVMTAQVVAIFKNYSQSDKFRNPDYPDTEVKLIDIRLQAMDYIGKYLEKRVEIHQNADKGKIEPCGPKDRWAKADVWKVFANGGKRSLQNTDTEALAIEWLEENKHKYATKGLRIDKIDGESVRCERHCPVREFCPQHKAELAAKSNK